MPSAPRSAQPPLKMLAFGCAFYMLRVFHGAPFDRHAEKHNGSPQRFGVNTANRGGMAILE
jgi:hypothetical protein